VSGRTRWPVVLGLTAALVVSGGVTAATSAGADGGPVTQTGPGSLPGDPIERTVGPASDDPVVHTGTGPVPGCLAVHTAAGSPACRTPDGGRQ
jgi:hypothetical protein